LNRTDSRPAQASGDGDGVELSLKAVELVFKAVELVFKAVELSFTVELRPFGEALRDKTDHRLPGLAFREALRNGSGTPGSRQPGIRE
jgi:hypothetical protein